jgi:hypothetical protein
MALDSAIVTGGSIAIGDPVELLPASEELKSSA